MKESRKTPFGKASLYLFLIVLMIAGCNYSKTFSWPSGSNSVVVTVKVPAGTVTPFAGISWIGGFSPIKKTKVKTLGGQDYWELVFTRPAGATSSTLGGKGFSSSWSVGPSYFYASSNGSGSPIRVRREVSLDVAKPGPNRTLTVANESTTLTAEIDQLEWAISTTVIPINNLSYSHPSVSSLPWNTLITTPNQILPGQSISFNLPGGALPQGSICYARTISNDPISGNPESYNVWVLPEAEHPIPTLSQWGLIILALFVLCLGGIAIKQRARKPITS